MEPLSTTMVCSAERKTLGKTQGSERASSLTLNTEVNPEPEDSSAQFQRTAYSECPSLFVNPAWLRASITRFPQNLGTVSNREGLHPSRLQTVRRSTQRHPRSYSTP